MIAANHHDMIGVRHLEHLESRRASCPIFGFPTMTSGYPLPQHFC
ncbi:hypothetical protein MPS_1648 [Mycobacterium pseudoshottsii JCM 15466]|uniref:Uncharacterized protein n=1 Tax=Mycobacterium ulcerans str. Harvey TaxID=1299332 RepID=A0ABP3A9J4_MYCUL|nr:hypothetical protein MMSP_1999 [Mycobacterium sp. 012931]EPQ75342.1 hypothetical protein MMMB2_0002 [Mycobacterium marinum MB2]EUA88027.1 hypothetical protein I551_5518 [Mycobacterium ulcerans str. Harvey]GAQ33435.1 hypothetical protein MPS_1648 [Mycobacterium pseudoshottsii JCM 15466]